MTHKDKLLSWFRRGLSITPAEAVDQWSNYRLADTVYQLRQDGHQINTQTMERINEDGRRVTWARYTYQCGPKGETVTPAPQACDPRSLPASQDEPAGQDDNLLRRMRRAFFGGAS